MKFTPDRSKRFFLNFAFYIPFKYDFKTKHFTIIKQ
jgi:hypothetical protein